MSRAFVVMTALPPTRGHLRLLQFSSQLADHTVVLVCTQPGEPFSQARYVALAQAAKGLRVSVRWFHQTIEQNPEAPGFWKKWYDILSYNGFKPGDYIVASEQYGVKFAQEMGGHFIPYDPYREILPTKATEVRHDLEGRFSEILPDFQPALRQTVTVFGCESTGKTTLTRELARTMDGHFLPEWARPYMETCGAVINTQTMTDIWQGQKALQLHADKFLLDKPYLFQDTDLFSTVGYWDFWNGETPDGLVEDAHLLKSDLYLILQSVIPFEPDPLRFGGDKRESDDAFWIALAEKHELNYKIIRSDDRETRASVARVMSGRAFLDNARELINFQREFNEPLDRTLVGV